MHLPVNTKMATKCNVIDKSKLKRKLPQLPTTMTAMFDLINLFILYTMDYKHVFHIGLIKQCYACYMQTSKG